MTPKKRRIKFDELARVEGEGALDVQIRGNVVEQVKLQIFEPPRFFEALLRGRSYLDAPDITARICGICPVAYLMSACHAMEDACNTTVNGQLRALRRLLYCGEWIESHMLHVGMLHLPDFLGYPDAIQMAKDHRELVERVLRIKAIGNRILTVLGGREVHQVNVKVGGLYRAPEARELDALRADLEWGLAASQQTLQFLSGLTFPDFEQDYQFLALHHPDEYPFNEGRLRSNTGIDAEVANFEQLVVETQVPHATALHARDPDGRPYHVGPLARFALNAERLTPLAAEAAASAGLSAPCRNPYKSILVRTVEIIFCFEHALQLLSDYSSPSPSAVCVKPQEPCTGYGCTEAPRGICYHRYDLEGDGTITSAQISPPTCINQPAIEADLYRIVCDHLSLDDQSLRERCESGVRNYDPCISCATHFLKLNVTRR